METKDVIGFLGKKVKLVLNKEFNYRYYKGQILEIGIDTLTINDINDSRVLIRLEHINIIEECL